MPDAVSFFFFNDTATTEIYTLALHDALPISRGFDELLGVGKKSLLVADDFELDPIRKTRSEEHTSELQSLYHLGCRLLLAQKSRVRAGSRAGPTTPARSSSPGRDCVP